MNRAPRIINFCSLAKNVGNYTARWGIETMLAPYRFARSEDCRNFRGVDLAEYDVAIIGGAGLLYTCFSDFWAWMAEARIPCIIWGVGASQPATGTRSGREGAGLVDRVLIERLRDRIVLCNVRDRFTADHYGFDADVTFCPTVAWVRAKYPSPSPEGKGILYAHHPEIATRFERAVFRRLFSFTTNRDSVEDEYASLLKMYRETSLVITTRLHGAIIANCFGKPYVAIPHDAKVSAYHAEYGGGLLARNWLDALRLVTRAGTIRPEIDERPVYAFAERVKTYLSSLSSRHVAG